MSLLSSVSLVGVPLFFFTIFRIQGVLFHSHPRTPFRFPMKSEPPVINRYLTRRKNNYFFDWVNTWQVKMGTITSWDEVFNLEDVTWFPTP